RAGRSFRFDVGLPLAAETVEVVDQVSAHEGGHGGVNVRQLNLLLEYLLLIYVGVELGHRRLIRWDCRADLRTLFQGSKKCIDILGEGSGVVRAGTVFENHGDTAGG